MAWSKLVNFNEILFNANKPLKKSKKRPHLEGVKKPKKSLRRLLQCREEQQKKQKTKKSETEKAKNQKKGRFDS